MRFGADAYETIGRVKERLSEIEAGLPPGVRLRTTYDRSDLIERAIRTLREKLLEESLIVAAVIGLFLFHARSALVVVVTLPLGILFSFVVMRLFGVSSNIMSLGGIAIAIGAMVDAAIVMVENMHKHLERATSEGQEPDRWEASRPGNGGMRRSLVEGGGSRPVLLAPHHHRVSFLPVFSLEAQEGRLFKPLACTKTLAMVGAAYSQHHAGPGAMGLVRPRADSSPEYQNPASGGVQRLYRPGDPLCHATAWPVVAGADHAVLIPTVPCPSSDRLRVHAPTQRGDHPLHADDAPWCERGEGSRDPSVAGFDPGVVPRGRKGLRKDGPGTTATDPAPLSMFETTIVLKPEEEWRPGMTYEALVEEMDRNLRIAGVTNSWTMPIKGRIDMLATGIRTPVGIKIFGPDLDTHAGAR